MAVEHAAIRYRTQNIPDDLKALDRWVVFALEGVKHAKVPYIPGTTRKARSNDASTWRSFAVAHAAAERSGLYLGFAFTPDLGMTFIDLDHVLGAEGVVKKYAQLVVDTLDSYTEASLNDGLHVFVQGRPPEHFTMERVGGKVEVYPQAGGRFCLITGFTRPGIGSLDGLIEERTEELAGLFPARTRTPPTASSNGTGADLTDDEIDAIVGALRRSWVDGQKHELGLAIGGILAKNGVPETQALTIMERISSAEDRPHEREQVVSDSYERARNGLDIRGYQALREIVPGEALAIVDGILSRVWNANQVKPQRPTRAPRDEANANDASEPVPFADVPHRTDMGNANRMVERHGTDLRYCGNRKAWLVWDGRRWLWDESGEVQRRAKETVLSWYPEAATLAGPERADLVKHAISCESASRLAAMVELARSEVGIPVAIDDLDRDPWALNVLNGTLDLRTGNLRPHDQADYMTRLIPVAYDPLESCPTFLAFLDQILQGKQDLITFLQRAIGYSLTGLTVERCMFILWGGGKNGKSTLLDTLLGILGDFAARTATDTLMFNRNGGGIPNDIARLKGMRFAYASEGEQGKRLAESKIKDITGGDTLTARFMRAEWFDFRPEFKLWLGTNHKPVILGTDDAIWDRIKLIPFNVRIPPEEQDKHLKDKLMAEAPGILAWAVEGCLDWQRHGLGEPADIRDATSQYRSSEDIIGRFLNEQCEQHESASVTKKALYAAYREWCEDEGEKPVTQKAFGSRMLEIGLDEAMWGSSKNRERVWLGVSLLRQDEHHEG